MKVLYIDCGMGAAGDMLTAALLEIACSTGSDSLARVDYSKVESFIKRFHAAGIPGVEMHVTGGIKQGITGTQVRIFVNGEEEDELHEGGCSFHHEHGHCHNHDDHEQGHCHNHDNHKHEHAHVHRSMQDIEAVINGLALDDEIKSDILSIYKIIAEAEGRVHGKQAGEVHFHEVGTMDAVADVTAVCMLIHELAPDKIVASPVATGYGTVKCAHGVLPVPAPATAIILHGVPAYAGEIRGELCTPTGAALIKYFAQEYSQMPLMRTKEIGYGLGKKTFDRANCLRIFCGER